MAFIPIYIFILALTIFIDYAAGLLIERTEGKRRKVYLAISIVSTCGALFVSNILTFLTPISPNWPVFFTGIIPLRVCP
jgi:Na+/H+ antiporter NhaD/arsenite permease-like protein